MAELTYENKRSLVQGAIKNLYPGEMLHPWVEDMTDSKVIYNVSGKTYQASYSINGETEVKMGTPTEVVRKVSYHNVKLVSKGVKVGK